MLNRLRDAARRRLARSTGDESGFALIYVLMISTLVTVITGTTLVAASGNIVPAVRNSYQQAAYSAALAGLQAFLGYVDGQCPNQNSTLANCSPPQLYTVNPVTIYSANGYSSTYQYSAVKVTAGGYFRVASTGVVQQGGLKETRVLLADIAGGASTNLLDYGVVTGFETESPTAILSQFARRTIGIDNTMAKNASGPVKGGQIVWAGASPGTAAGKLSVCNSLFSGVQGRSNNPPPGAPNPYVDWSESALQGNKFTDYQSCSTAMTHLTKLLAPANPADGTGGYFTDDALLLSNSWPGGTGPLLNQPVTTKYQYAATDGACATPGQNYRSFNLICAGYPIEMGGSPDPTSQYGVQWVQNGPNVPTTSATVPSTACVYNGPTRIVLNSNGSATVTSPQTTLTFVATSTSPAQCYTGAANGTGMSVATVSLTTPTVIPAIYAQNSGNVPNQTPALAHGSTGWPATGQKVGTTPSTSNTVFSLTSGTAGTTTSSSFTATAPDTGYNPPNGSIPSSTTDGAFTPLWTSETGNTNCTTSTSSTDLRLFNCYYGTSGTAYPAVKTDIQSGLVSTPSAAASTSALTTFLNSSSVLAKADSADGSQATPNNMDNTSHRWRVSSVVSDTSPTDGCTPSSNVPSSSNTAITPPANSDPMFSNHAGNTAVAKSTTTTCLTASIGLQVGTCGQSSLSLCTGPSTYVWGNGQLGGGGASVAQFRVTVTGTSVSTTTTVTPATSYFPHMSDVTQYSIGTNGTFGDNGPGDLYVEGSSANSIALLAANDAIVTGPLSAADTTSKAVELVSYDDIRIYHPVKCVVTDSSLIATTDPGWCPDDLTGMYNTVLPNGARPDQQYTNMRPDLANLTLHGAFFALGIPQSNVQCPQPPQGNGGICGGQFSADNYNRGDSVGMGALGTLTVVGTLAMAHHGPVGQEWEIADTRGQSSRPYSGYGLAEQYQNLKNALNGINLLQTKYPTSSLWHIVSISTGAS